MESSSIITPEDVLESLMNDGTIDAMRLKIINQLKTNITKEGKAIDLAKKAAERKIKAANQNLQQNLSGIQMGPSSIITPNDVVERLMDDGTIDALRLKIKNQLKANEELKNTTIKMVEQSKVLNTPGAEKQTKRELFDALRQELEASVLEMASKAVWKLILDDNGLGKDINETVENVFCQLSGLEPPLYPQNVEAELEKQQEEASVKGKGKEIESEKENSDSASKKRGFEEMNSLVEAIEAASGSSKPLAVPDDSSKLPLSQD